MVVILAAGRGSRMKLESGVSKCSVRLPDGRSSVKRLIDQFKELGEDQFVVVVGYGSDSVIDSVRGYKDCSITWIYNDHYSDRGCEYSLASAAPTFSTKEDLIIVEGDLVTCKDNFQSIVSSYETSVLVRPSWYLSDRSVAVVCDDNSQRVLKFLYDQSHHYDMSSLAKIVPTVYDSFQVWKFSKDDVHVFKSALNHYKNSIDFENNSDEIRMASGLLSINSCISNRARMIPCEVPYPNDWVNLNSEEDIEKLNQCRWYKS